MADEIDCQALVLLDTDPRFVLQERADHLHALVERKQPALLGIDAYANDELVKQLHTPADDVEVPVGDRVELTRKDANFVRAGFAACDA